MRRLFPFGARAGAVHALFTAMIILGFSPAQHGAEPFRKTLISVDQNVRIDEWQLVQPDFKEAETRPWAIRKRVLRGGKQDGVDIVEVDNGVLRIVACPTRGMSILEIVSSDVRLGWNSPVREVVHPRHIRLESRGGLGWLEGFNEWMVRCGLEFAGHPGTDRFVNNTGDEAEMDLTLHGKIGNIPASEVEVLVDREPPNRIRIRGRVDERMFYGPQFELWTEISTVPGSSSFRISDSLRHTGAFDQEFQIIYHANFGPPLLESGARVLGAFRSVAPFNAHAAGSIDSFDVYAGPVKGFTEQVFCVEPVADSRGLTRVALRNAAGNRAVSMAWRTAELPYLTVWKNTASHAEGYVTGLEPGTGFPYNRRVEREFGRVPKLSPLATRTFTLDFEIHSGRDAVDRLTASIDALQESIERQLIREPKAP